MKSSKAKVEADVAAILADLQPKDIAKLGEMAAEMNRRGVPCEDGEGWTARKVLRRIMSAHTKPSPDWAHRFTNNPGI